MPDAPTTGKRNGPRRAGTGTGIATGIGVGANPKPAASNLSVSLSVSLSIADALTLGNAACGVCSIIALVLLYPNISLATGYIFIGMILDGADGAAARRFGSSHELGRYLDSFADAITFCLAPGLMVISVYFRAGAASADAGPVPGALVGVLAVVTGMLIIVLGWLRLYGFTVWGYRLERFSGLATPALTFFVLILCHLLPAANPWSALIALPLLICAALMMVSRVEYPKLRGRPAIAFTVGITAGLLTIVGLKWSGLVTEAAVGAVYRTMVAIGVGMIVVYILILPFLLHRRRAPHRPAAAGPGTGSEGMP